MSSKIATNANAAVVHFVVKSAVKTELPLLFTNRVPEPKSSSLGTGNWSVAPRAVVFGGAFSAADIEELRGLISGTENARRIPWLHADITLGTVSPPPFGVYKKEYADSVLQRMKAVLARLQEEGKLDGDGDDGLYPF